MSLIFWFETVDTLEVTAFSRDNDDGHSNL